MAGYAGLTVLLTGAAGGFGAAVATALAAQGARLVLCDLAEAPLQALADGLAAETVCIAGDVRDAGLHARLVEAAEDLGGLAVAINNAGISHDGAAVGAIDADQARAVIEVNLMGTLWGMQAQIPALAARFKATGAPGAVVNVASAAGLVGAPRLAVYAASKHGVVGLTRSAAAEWAAKGVRVNAVCPGFAHTPLMQGELERTAEAMGLAAAQVEAGLTQRIPARRLASAAEAAEAILWAGSPANSYTTGAALAVDGGYSAV